MPLPPNQYIPEDVDPRMQAMANLVNSEEAILANQHQHRERSHSNEYNDSRRSFDSSDDKHYSKKHKSRRHRRSPSYSQ